MDTKVALHMIIANQERKNLPDISSITKIINIPPSVVKDLSPEELNSIFIRKSINDEGKEYYQMLVPCAGFEVSGSRKKTHEITIKNLTANSLSIVDLLRKLSKILASTNKDFADASSIINSPQFGEIAKSCSFFTTDYKKCAQLREYLENYLQEFDQNDEKAQWKEEISSMLKKHDFQSFFNLYSYLR